ncbi:MAG TPA: hypothetical protein VL994_10310 [Steroidobacteraceae bacterium]|nr:hypothetical protein [Steroidobacteraceae bacterium]
MRTSTTLTIRADHPALAGHFPGMPILPGVLLLDETLRALESQASPQPRHWRIGRAKFLKPVGPGETLLLELEQQANGSVHFQVSSAGRAVAEGMLVAATDPDDDQQER